MAQLVYSGQSTDARHVVIDGRVVMRDRELLTLDLDSVMDSASNHAWRLAALVG